MGYNIDREVAAQDFERFIEKMRINLAVKMLDENDRGDIATAQERMILAIQEGSMTVDEDGVAKYTCEDGKEYTFHKPKGSVLLEMDRKKEHATMGKTFAIAGGLTRTSATDFANMAAEDTYNCLAVTTFFMP